MSNKDDGNFSRNYALWLNDATEGITVQFTSGGFQQWRNVDGGNVFDDEWHHIAGTYDMEFLTGYVDGVVVAESAFADEPDVNSDPVIIGNETPMYNYAVPLNGLMDDVALFDVGLTENEIGEIMEAGLSERFGISSAVSASGKLATTWAHLKVQ